MSLSRGPYYEYEVKLDWIPLEFDAWIRRFGLHGLVETNIHTTLRRVRSCAPRDASAESLALACMDLQCLLILDDYDADDAPDLFERYAAVLRRWETLGEDAPRTPGTGFLAAVDHFLARMVAQGRPLRRYLRGKMNHLRGIARRNAMRQGVIPSFTEYFDVRMTTIHVRQWMNLWEVLDGCVLPPDELAAEDLQEATDLQCVWQLYIGERAAATRDADARAPNLVTMLQREQGMTRSDAALWIRTLEEQALKDCRERLEALGCKDPSPRLQRYLEIFRACIDGTIRSHQDLPGRSLLA